VNLNSREWTVCVACALGAIALTLSPAVRAQHRPPPAYGAETELVRVTATVTDADGAAVTDLEQADFAIAEDGAAQDIALFARDLDTPVSVVVLLDVSGSMDDTFEAVRRGLRAFVAASRPDDEIALMTFNGTAQLLAPLDASREQLLTALNAQHAKGNTALYAAIVDGLRVLRDGRHRKKALLVVTDGHDTVRRVSPRAATHAFERAEVLMYGLGLGHGGPDSLRDRFLTLFDNGRMRALRSMAASSGGRAELVPSVAIGTDDLVAATIGEFGRELHQQYTLGYYPPPAASGKEMHTLRVTVRRPGHIVRAPKLYRRPTR
jgi:Ca-activated chloride channel family protein